MMNFDYQVSWFYWRIIVLFFFFCKIFFLWKVLEPEGLYIRQCDALLMSLNECLIYWIIQINSGFNRKKMNHSEAFHHPTYSFSPISYTVCSVSMWECICLHSNYYPCDDMLWKTIFWPLFISIPSQHDSRSCCTE